MQGVLIMKLFIELKKRFDDYVRKFDSDDPVDSNAIKLKIIHSIRVSNQIFHLGKALGLDAEKLETARLAGLFHDIGRFRQYAVYKTFNDSKSENHALLGLAEIDRFDFFSGLPDERSQIIRTAIENHSKIRIPDIADPETRFFCLLLRDADKLDIWRVMIAHVKKVSTGRHDPVTQNLPLGDAVSEKLLEFLDNGIPIPFSEVNNLNDYKLFLLSWVFDLNFRPSFEAALRRRIVWQLSDTLPPSSGLKTRMLRLEKRLDQFAE